MRTIIDLPQGQIDQMADLGKQTNLSRAELVRRAVAQFLNGQQASTGDDAFGLWRDKPVDAIEHQRHLRSEWDK